jgi:hypothetical protein
MATDSPACPVERAHRSPQRPIRLPVDLGGLRRSLVRPGPDPEELASLFRVGKGRPDWPGVAARGPIRVGVTDEDLDGLQVECSPLALPGGRAFLTSDRAGEVRLEPVLEADLHLLPPPLNLLLAQQWARLARFPLHAAALRWKDRGVLILGERGAGKSSLVLAASSLGGEVVSDDWLLTGVLRGQVRVERLREFLMFRPGAPWQAFGQGMQTLTGLTIVPGPDRRHVLPIHGSQPAFPTWTPIERMVFLQAPERERPAHSRLEPIHQSRLLAGLVEASMPRLLTGNSARSAGA